MVTTAAPAPGARAARVHRRRGLAPVVATDARVLILGSFPSEASLAARAYYAHPRNHFWRIVGALVHEPLPGMSHAERLACVQAHRIAIWDTIVACVRPGSLDTAIRDAVRADAAAMRRWAPALRVVGFNGKTAARAAAGWQAAGYTTIALPSTSPAYTLPFADKLAAWSALSRYLGND